MRTQINYHFLEALWDTGRNPRLRDQLWDLAIAGEQDLRSYLTNTFQIVIPSDVRLVLVDIERARKRSFVTDPDKDSFYALVLPPDLRRDTHDPGKEDYKEAQAWAGAWYHATSDGYGM